MNFDINNFPEKPGVYLFKDKNGVPLYIGKAKNIKKRLQSHFKEELDQRKIKIFENTETIDFIITEDEISALFLENNLIKAYQPKFNVNLKDDKTYPYIALSIRDKFPKIYYTRKVIEGNLYFGPFYPAYKAKKIISFIQKSFGICSCKRDLNKTYKKPCLYFYMKRCLGPCILGLITEKIYKKKLKQAILFLEGKDKKLLGEIKKEIEEKAKSLKFEEANHLKEIYLSIEEIKNTKNLKKKKEEEKDFFGIYKEGKNFSLAVLNFKGGLLYGKKSYIFENEEEESLENFLEQIVPQYYISNPLFPSKIVLRYPIREEIFLDFLKERVEKKVKIINPKRGKDLEILNLAEKNAKIFYEHKYPLKGLQDLKDLLSLENLFSIIAIDISHLQGRARYGGVIFFEGGKFEKKKYRVFKLHTRDARDDIGGIYEITKRYGERLKKEGEKFPHLILIDGGKGQLQSALKALRELDISIPTIALEKGGEKVYIKEVKEPLNIKKDSPALLLLMKIRDEAHRFVISLHRRVRKKSFIK